MRVHTFVVLIGCLLATAAVIATDYYCQTAPAFKPAWVCRTDTECYEEEEAKRYGEECVLLGDTMVCDIVDKH